MVTYCSVCRTGRVYESLVKGHPEKFRLVGMDHFNAMFEDVTTGSWWRQVTGQAVTGPLKGESLPEVESQQFSIKKLFELHPDALVVQVDAGSITYLVSGFGGDYRSYSGKNDPGAPVDTTPCIRVFLDGNCPRGHCVYANSERPMGRCAYKGTYSTSR